jgi:hypothetical protein
MKSRKLLSHFAIVFFPLFTASALLSLIYSLQVHEEAEINWGISLLLAICLATLLTWIQNRKAKQEQGL